MWYYDISNDDACNLQRKLDVEKEKNDVANSMPSTSTCNHKISGGWPGHFIDKIRKVVVVLQNCIFFSGTPRTVLQSSVY